MAYRAINRLYGRVYGWFDSKNAELAAKPLPARFSNRARLALLSLEERTVPATFVVSSTADLGAGTLREAIDNLNLSVDATNDINFTITTPATITLDSALATITKNVSINGPGQSNLTVTKSATGYRIFNIANADPTGLVTIKGMTLANASVAFNGGAISVTDGSITIQDSTVTGNTSTGGGGIAVEGTGTLTILRSTVSNNTSTGEGGGVRADSVSVSILDSTISGNKATGGAYGGGIYSYGAPGFLVSNSTISGNSCSGSGSGISLESSPAAIVRNSTLTGNTASLNFGDPGDGGAISLNFYTTGNLEINSCIVSGNVHTTGGKFDDISISANATATVSNTFFTDNPGGSFTDGGGNIQAAFSTLNLAGLNNNGGLTKTHALGLGSAAIDKGANPAPALTKDQTGVTAREVDGGIGSAIADMGAFEFTPGVPTANASGLVNVTSDQPGINNPYTFTVTYQDAVTMKAATIGDAADIEISRIGGGFTVSATFVSATPTVDSPSIAATYKFTPPGGAWDASDKGDYNVNLLAGAVKNTGGTAVPAGTLGTFNVAFPTIFVVTNDADSGTGSLRQAIDDANLNIGADLITFDAGFFSSAKTITLASTLKISDDVTINGPGSKFVTVSGNNIVRIMDTSAAIAGAAITISNLRLANGSTSAGGGAILIDEEVVTLNNMVIEDNKAASSGGAISLDNIDAILTVNDSRISGNKSSNNGGAINIDGDSSVIVNRSTISGNFATGDGGAIYFFSGGSLTVTDTTLSGNTAAGTGSGGGAVYFWGTVSAGGFNVSNSTITGNSTGGSGGGLWFTYFTGTATIRNSTITGNTSGTLAAYPGSGGGGIGQNSSSYSQALIIESSVISGNVSNASNGRDDLSAEVLVNINYSAVFDADGFTPDPGSANNLASGLNYKLSPILKNNGGPTSTHAILPGSPLIGAGSNVAPPLTKDQTGVNARDLDGAVDIGAVEFVAGDPAAIIGGLVNVTADLPANNPYSFTVNYLDATAIQAATVGDAPDIQIVRVGGGFSVNATFVSAVPNTNDPSIVATYKITPPGGTWDPADDGIYNVNMLASAVQATSGKFVAAGTLGSFSVLFPQTFVVTNDADTGVGSLRDAVAAADAHGGPDFVTFDPGFFSTAKVITLASTISVGGDVTITGPGVKLASVSGGNAVRVFDTSAASVGAVINISNLTITGGSVAGGGAGLFINDEKVTLTNVAVSGNVAAGGAGGGIYATGAGTLAIVNSTISSNSATGSGGGLFRGFSLTTGLTITQSTISNNTTSAAFGGGGGIFANSKLVINQSTISGNTHTGTSYGGGGIYFVGSGTGSILEIKNSTITGNSTAGKFGTIEGGGGGVYVFVAPETISIINTTISANTAPFGGGFSIATKGTVQFSNSTIVGNSATETSGGGGIYSTGDAGTVINVDSTIVAGNTSAGVDEDFGINNPANTTLNASYSAWNSVFTPNGTDDNNKSGVTLASMELGTLGNNGGPTQTISIGSTSVLKDAANPTQSEPFDQRGTGFNRVVGPAADIGAFEIQGGVTVLNYTVNGGAAQRSRLTTITVNFSGPVTAASFTGLGAITLTRTMATPTGTVGTIVQTGATGANGLITVTQAGPNSLTLTFSNANSANESAGVEYGSLADGRWQLAIPTAGAYTSTLNDVNLRRLFGDFEAGPAGSNGTVDAGDLGTFGVAFGSSGAPGFSPYDYDNNGTVSGDDLGAFGVRFGVSV